MTEYEKIAMAKMRESYMISTPVVTRIMHNHERVKAMIVLLRSSIVLSPNGSTEATKIIVEYLDAIMAHLNSMIGVVGAMHGAMEMVHRIMAEQESMPVVELPDRWEGADG